MEKCPDLLSDYFSFVKGIVDSQDLSLNISREMLQKDSQLKLIHNALEKKIKSELTAMKNNERDKYEEFFKNFGRQLKYGCYSDYGTHSDLLKDLLLFYSCLLYTSQHALHLDGDGTFAGQADGMALQAGGQSDLSNLVAQSSLDGLEQGLVLLDVYKRQVCFRRAHHGKMPRSAV